MDVDLVLWLVLLVRSELPSFLVGVFTWFGCPRWFGWCDCCVILSALRFAVFVVGVCWWGLVTWVFRGAMVRVWWVCGFRCFGCLAAGVGCNGYFCGVFVVRC